MDYNIYLLIALSVILFVTAACQIREKRALAPKKKTEAIVAKKKKEYSWAAKSLMEMFEALPEVHRPGMDIEAAVSAIDIKYGIEDIDLHYKIYQRYSYDIDSMYKMTWNCRCVHDEDYETPEEFLADECRDFPEFWVIKNAINEVNQAINEREQAIKDHEKKMVLAGIESDLRSVDNIAEALRAERDALTSITDELRS